MPIPTINPLPTPPSRTDSANFSARGDAFLGALPTFQAETNAAIDAINAVYFPPQFRNRLINGDFSRWARGASQTTAGYGSDDRWANENVGSTKTHSQQAFLLGQTAVPGEPASLSRTVVTSSAGASNYVYKAQRIESVRTFAGRTVALSFWAKADATRPIAVELSQYFGAGGSPSATVTGIGAQLFTLTTAWQRFKTTVAVPSISGKTLGTDGKDVLQLAFWFDAGSSFAARAASLGQQSGTFDLALVQLEEGSSDTSFEFRPPGLELMLCLRYHYRITAGSVTNERLSASGISTASTSSQAYLQYPVPMRGVPSPSVGNVANIGIYDGSTLYAASAWGVDAVGPNGANLTFTHAAGATVGRPCQVARAASATPAPYIDLSAEL